MQNAFCVILSKYRLYQGIALYRSLDRHYSNFKMFILCIDDETYQICDRFKLKNVTLLKVKDFNDERLVTIKQSRRLNEYCWTLKPFYIEHVLRNYDFVDHAIYLDADIFFFNDPSPIFESQSDYTLLLSEHNYVDSDGTVEQVCGKYNSGFMIFKRCDTSLDILKWWKEKCIEWCFDGVDNGRFGDQKYLDYMPQLFPGVKSITTPGVNVAPWNDSRYVFQHKLNKVFINKDKLIFYHFCGFRLNDRNSFSLLIGNQKLNPIIHKPYIAAVQKAIALIEQSVPEFKGYFLESHFENRAKRYKMPW